jgi:hypothetical protein
MSKYCIVCGKEKEGSNPFIEGEPLECDECAQKIHKAFSKMIAKTMHRGKSIIVPNPIYKEDIQANKHDFQQIDAMEMKCNRCGRVISFYNGKDCDIAQEEECKGVDKNA